MKLRDVVALFFLIFTLSGSFALSQPQNTIEVNSITLKKFDLSEWPKDIRDRLIHQIPELKKNTFTAEDFDRILKAASKLYSFDQLKIVEQNNTYYLVGSISSKVVQIDFSGLKGLTDEEALEILALNINEADQENKVQSAVEKLTSTLRSRGYRKAQVGYSYILDQVVHRKLVFQIKAGPQTKVVDIKLNGLTLDDQKKIERLFLWHGKGDQLSDETLKEINQTLRAGLNQRGLYLVTIPNPQIQYSADETKATVKFNLEPQQKYEVELVGNKNFSTEYLSDEIIKLQEFTATESNFGAELSDKIKKFYLQKGYANIDVPFYERKQNDKIILTLNIEEGPLVRIDDLSISGQISRPEKYYITKFYELASTKTQDHILVKSDLEQASQNLITQLQNEGYVQAKLSRLQIGADRKHPENGVVVLQIDEGPQTEITSVLFENNKAFSREQLSQIFKLEAHQKLNLYELEKSLNALKVYYADHGYIESKVTNENTNLVTYSDDFTQAQIKISLFEGPQISVGQIIVEGNNLTHAKLITTELDFKVGDLLTPTKLEESVSRLQRTGHFSSTEIYTVEANTDTAIRTVVIKVSERNPGIFTSGVGVTNENNYTMHGYLGVAYRNIGGWGRGASARAEGKYNPDYIKFIESKLTFGYLEPYLFDTRMRFRLNYTSSRSVTDLSIRKVTVANQTVWSLEQDFTSHITGIYEVLNVSNYVDRGIDAEDEIKYGYSREDQVISSTGPTIDLDYRDNIFNPQKGHWSRLTVEYSTSALGNHNVDDFLRTTGQSTLYSPLNEEKGLIWVNSYRAGYVQNLENSSFGVPFDKKGFILGGRSTIRGFEASEFFPSTSTLGANFKLHTWSSYQLIKSELRFPLMPKYDLMGAFFYDGGEVVIGDTVLSDRWRDAVGFGLRYNTPVGPLNLEYARKLDKKSSESEGAFHLSVGVF